MSAISPARPAAPHAAVAKRHWLVRTGLVTLLFSLLVGTQFALAEQIAFCWLSLVQPLCPADAQTVTLMGTPLRVPPPAVTTLLAVGAMTHLLLLPLLICLYAYHRLSPCVPRLDGHTRCGRCGYILKGITEPRCPECGRPI